MALTILNLIEFNRRRAARSGPYRASDYPSQPGSHPPHKWSKQHPEQYVPTCRGCGLTPLEAQLANPTTFGEGPCPKPAKPSAPATSPQSTT
jgi:hypothetical protein